MGCVWSERFYLGRELYWSVILGKLTINNDDIFRWSCDSSVEMLDSAPHTRSSHNLFTSGSHKCAVLFLQWNSSSVVYRLVWRWKRSMNYLCCQVHFKSRNGGVSRKEKWNHNVIKISSTSESHMRLFFALCNEAFEFLADLYLTVRECEGLPWTDGGCFPQTEWV